MKPNKVRWDKGRPEDPMVQIDNEWYFPENIQVCISEIDGYEEWISYTKWKKSTKPSLKMRTKAK